MTTRALAARGKHAPDLFFMEVRNHPWDGSTGLDADGGVARPRYEVHQQPRL